MPDYIVVIRDREFGTRYHGTTCENSEAAVLEALQTQPLAQILNPETIIGIWVESLSEMEEADGRLMTRKALGLEGLSGKLLEIPRPAIIKP